MEQRTSLAEIIEYIDPGSLSYQEWCSVGMALKLEGYPISVWDQKRFQQIPCRRMRAKMEVLFRILFSCDWWDDCSDGNRTWLGA